jgi:hypothetical protein
MTLTRIVSALYVGAAAAAGFYFGWEKVATVAGILTFVASAAANVLKDGTPWDAICNGLAINVVPGKTAAGK